MLIIKKNGQIKIIGGKSANKQLKELHSASVAIRQYCEYMRFVADDILRDGDIAELERKNKRLTDTLNTAEKQLKRNAGRKK